MIETFFYVLQTLFSTFYRRRKNYLLMAYNTFSKVVNVLFMILGPFLSSSQKDSPLNIVASIQGYILNRLSTMITNI